MWESSDLSIIGEYAKRKTTSLRSECEAHVQDILTALTQLDQKDKMPLLTIDYLSLSCIPRSHPEELTNISLVDRLNRLEKSLVHLQQVVDGNMAGNMELRDKLDKISNSSYASALMKPISVSEKTPYTPCNPHNVTDLNQCGSPNKDPLYSSPNNLGNNVSAPSSQFKNPNTVLQSLNQKVTSLEPTDNSDGFQLPSYAAKQQRRMAARSNRVVTGCGKSNSVKGAPSRTKDLFIFRVDPSTTTDSLHTHIRDHHFNIISLQQVSKPMSKYKSFRLIVPISEFNKLLDGAMWPEGISVRRFVPPRSGSSEKTDTV